MRFHCFRVSSSRVAPGWAGTSRGEQGGAASRGSELTFSPSLRTSSAISSMLWDLRSRSSYRRLEMSCFISFSSPANQSALLYITLRYITLHYIALRCVALRCVTLHYITLRCVALRYITLRCVALRYITLHYVALRYITLHCIALHYITLHYIALQGFSRCSYPERRILKCINRTRDKLDKRP